MEGLKDQERLIFHAGKAWLSVAPGPPTISRKQTTGIDAQEFQKMNQGEKLGHIYSEW